MRKFQSQAPTEHTNRRKNVQKKNRVRNVSIFRLSFHFCTPPLVVGIETKKKRSTHQFSSSVFLRTSFSGGRESPDETFLLSLSLSRTRRNNRDPSSPPRLFLAPSPPSPPKKKKMKENWSKKQKKITWKVNSTSRSCSFLSRRNWETE